MFDYYRDDGLGAGKWLKWFMVAMTIYAACTYWPQNRVVTVIGGVFAFAGYNIARYQIAKGRRGR
jgi:hypothetical protein